MSDALRRDAPARSLVTTSRRDLLLGGLFVTAAGVALVCRPRHPIIGLPDGNLETAVPMQIGAWSAVADNGFVMPPEDEQRAAAVYEQQLARSYVDGVDAPVMMLIAYDRSQSGMLMIHRPESCYPGSGFEVTAIRDTPVPLTPTITAYGRFLSTRRDTRIEQVLYWTRLGNSFPATWDAQRRSIAMQNLGGAIPDGALVRLSMISADPDAALPAMQRFASSLFAACGARGRGLLAGPINA